MLRYYVTFWCRLIYASTKIIIKYSDSKDKEKYLFNEAVLLNDHKEKKNKNFARERRMSIFDLDDRVILTRP